MDSWIVQLLTLLGVAVGAIASFVSTRLLERTRWQREEILRWDTKRLDCYSEFAAATNQFVQTAMRLAGGLGLPSTGQPLDSASSLATAAGSSRAAWAGAESAGRWSAGCRRCMMRTSWAAATG